MRTMTTLSRGIAAVGTAGLLGLGFATAAYAGERPTGDAANHPENWVSYIEDEGYTGVECAKIADSLEGDSWAADQDYVLVVLKNATYNDEFWEVPTGEELTTDSHEGKTHAISHIIVCTADLFGETATEAETPVTTPATPPATTTTTVANGEPIGPIVETDIVESSSTTPAVLGGAAALSGLGLAGAAMRRKGQN